LGVYLFPFTSATILHFFLGVFLHFITGDDKAAMVDQGTEVLQGDGWKTSWKNVSSSRFDSKAFHADHADLYSQYSKATTTTRFILSV
jgi:hypothetical protein